MFDLEHKNTYLRVDVPCVSVDAELREREKLDYYFPLVRVNSISLDDIIFTQFVCQTYEERKFKTSFMKLFSNAERKKQFRVPRFQPSFDLIKENNKYIYNIDYYDGGEFSFVCKDAHWWSVEAKGVYPSKKSRLGTNYDWYRFLGYLVHYLVHEKDYDVHKAWETILYPIKESEMDDVFDFTIGDWHFNNENGFLLTSAFGVYYMFAGKRFEPLKIFEDSYVRDIKYDRRLQLSLCSPIELNDLQRYLAQNTGWRRTTGFVVLDE